MFSHKLLLVILSASSVLCTPILESRQTTWWKPTLQNSFQIQLSGVPDSAPKVNVFELDGDTPASTVARFKTTTGRRVIAYINGGAWESYRADASSFPASVLGNTLDDWPNEKWLDIRQISILQPIMTQRAQRAKQAGYDAIDWDNVDGYENPTGFPLTYAQQISYNKMLATITHNLGMAVGLKNDIDQIPDLVNYYDFAVNEQCQQYSECQNLAYFTRAGKPVVGLEYVNGHAAVCANAPSTEPNVYVLYKKLSLDATGWDCQLNAAIST